MSVASDADGSVFDNLRQVTGVAYNRAEHNRDILDTYLLRQARNRGIRLTSNPTVKEYKYHGAFVQPPTAGINEHVVYVDVSSLYPNLIIALNASPETIIGTEADLEESPYTEDDCVWGYIDPRPVKHVREGDKHWQEYTDGTYKIVYDHTGSNPSTKWSVADADNDCSIKYERCYFLDHETQEGFLPSCVDDLIALKDQYRGTSLYGSTKRVVNSVYGITGFATDNSAFRLFDWRIAESITLCGRKLIQWTRDETIDHVEENHGLDAHAALGDTDGMGISLEAASTRHEAYSAVEEAVDWINKDGYNELMEQMSGVDPSNHEMELEVESYAPRVFVPAKNPSDPDSNIGVKKRYGQWLTIEDDEEVDEVDVTGLEMERSDVAEITKDAQEIFFENVLRDGRTNAKAAVFEELREMATTLRDGEYPLEYVSKRGGIGQSLDDYGTPNRTPQPIYRGSKYADEYLDGVDIGEGSKPMTVYVKYVNGSDYPSTYSAETAEDGNAVDAVALPQPERLPDDFVIDWSRHWNKVLKSPMQPLIETLGWKWDHVLHSHSQSGLADF